MEYSNLVVVANTPKSVEHTGSQFKVNFQPPVAGVSFKATYDSTLDKVTVLHVAMKPELEKQVDELLSKEGECTIVEKDPKTGVFHNPTRRRSALVPKVRAELDGYIVKMYGVANSFSEPVLS